MWAFSPIKNRTTSRGHWREVEVRRRTAAFIGILALFGAGLAIPTVAAARMAHTVAHHPGTLKGRLDTYTIHSKAIIDLGKSDQHVHMSRHTTLRGHLHHGHLNRGDRIVASVKWVKNSAMVTSMTDEGNGGGDNEDFSGAYQSSTTTSLVITADQEDSCTATVTFTTNSTTQYYDQNGALVSGGLTYTAGELLDVTATQQADGTWLANTVSVNNDQGDGSGDSAVHPATSIHPMDGSGSGGCDNQGGDGGSQDGQGGDE
jgi:hypothetical protein